MRDKVRIAERNKKLFERYYYWADVVRLRPDDALRKVAQGEFFLSEFTAGRIIKQMAQSGAQVDGKALSYFAIKGLSMFERKKKPLSAMPGLFDR